MSWDLCRGGPKHDEIGLVHPRVSFTSPKSLVPIIYICIYIYMSHIKRSCLLACRTRHIFAYIYIILYYMWVVILQDFQKRGEMEPLFSPFLKK